MQFVPKDVMLGERWLSERVGQALGLLCDGDFWAAYTERTKKDPLVVRGLFSKYSRIVRAVHAVLLDPQHGRLIAVLVDYSKSVFADDGVPCWLVRFHIDDRLHPDDVAVFFVGHQLAAQEAVQLMADRGCQCLTAARMRDPSPTAGEPGWWWW